MKMKACCRTGVESLDKELDSDFADFFEGRVGAEDFARSFTAGRAGLRKLVLNGLVFGLERVPVGEGRLEAADRKAFAARCGKMALLVKALADAGRWVDAYLVGMRAARPLTDDGSDSGVLAAMFSGRAAKAFLKSPEYALARPSMSIICKNVSPADMREADAELRRLFSSAENAAMVAAVMGKPRPSVSGNGSANADLYRLMDIVCAERGWAWKSLWTEKHRWHVVLSPADELAELAKAAELSVRRNEIAVGKGLEPNDAPKSLSVEQCWGFDSEKEMLECALTGAVNPFLPVQQADGYMVDGKGESLGRMIRRMNRAAADPDELYRLQHAVWFGWLTGRVPPPEAGSADELDFKLEVFG